jgi:hypothetical protein
MVEKDKIIENLKEEIEYLKKGYSTNQDSVSSITLKQSLVEDEMKTLKQKCKLLEGKNSRLHGKIATLTQNIEAISNKETNEEINVMSTDIPTSNQYMTLPDESAHENPIPIEPPSNQDSDLQPNEEKSAENLSTQIKPPAIENPNLPSPSNKPINHAETIILCDSNGCYLIPSLLCPTSKTSYLRYPTLMQAKEILDKTCFSNPKTFIIHTGTNDLEQPSTIESLMKKPMDIVELIHTKCPKYCVILSSLLPRSDDLNNKAVDFNESLSKALSARKNTTFVRHQNIRAKDHLHDKKHLNKVGVKQLAQNLNHHIPNLIHLQTRNTCMRQPLAYIYQTLFQHEIFVITPTLNAGSRCHVMLVMATQ